MTEELRQKLIAWGWINAAGQSLTWDFWKRIATKH